MTGEAPGISAGAHLKVGRGKGLYDHHGIYISADRVIDFSGEGSGDKSQARIRARSYADFCGADFPSEMQYPQPHLAGLAMPPVPALPPEEVIDRAEWLVRQPTAGRYNLLGSNCEHLAVWCKTGVFESSQVRKWFLLPGLGAIAALIYNFLPLGTWKKLLDQYPGCGNWQANSIEEGGNGAS
jgi:hypothetical protein